MQRGCHQPCCFGSCATDEQGTCRGLVLQACLKMLAFFAWSVYEFNIHSCFHKRTEEIAIRVSMGVILQFLCSYVTMPPYALVTQMGTTMKPTISNDKVAAALKNWHKTAKKNTRHNRGSETNTPFSSRPATPTHGMSPVRLLHNFRSSTADDTPSASPRLSSNYENFDYYNTEETPSPSNRGGDGGGSDFESRHLDYEPRSPPPAPVRAANHEISINLSEFSFGK